MKSSTRLTFRVEFDLLLAVIVFDIGNICHVCCEAINIHFELRLNVSPVHSEVVVDVFFDLEAHI